MGSNAAAICAQDGTVRPTPGYVHSKSPAEKERKKRRERERERKRERLEKRRKEREKERQKEERESHIDIQEVGETDNACIPGRRPGTGPGPGGRGAWSAGMPGTSGAGLT